MPVEFIPTHKEWTALRDKAGGKSNMVSSVNIGKLLDEYHKARGDKTGVPGMILQVKQINALSAGFRKYQAALPKDKPELIKLCAEINKAIDAKVRMGAEIANPVLKLRTYLELVIAESKKVMASGDKTAYQKLWNGPVRGTGTVLAPLGKIDKMLANIHKVWLPYATDKWDAKSVAPASMSTAEQAAAVKKAAKEFNGLAVKVQSELKAVKMIA